MIRCVRLFTDQSGQSDFEVGQLALAEAQGDLATIMQTAQSISFQETASGGSFDWHEAPAHQYVVTLKGELEFETRTGKRFNLAPGDVLLAEDTTGGGHRWHLTNKQPWLRAYVILSHDFELNFVPDSDKN